MVTTGQFGRRSLRTGGTGRLAPCSPRTSSTRCPTACSWPDPTAPSRWPRRWRRGCSASTTPPRWSAGRWPRCCGSRTPRPTRGWRATSPTTASAPAPRSPSSRGCCPTAPRCWSPRGSAATSGSAPVTKVAVSIRSGRGRARLDRERSDLVATVAHELRSPLTGVKGFVQALLNRWDKLNDEQKKLMLLTVSADSDRLSRLIAELLDVARIDTGRLQMYPRPADAEVLVRRIVESVAAGTARDVELEVDELPEVFVDPDKFTQVVTNLVENAVRHGEGTVRVDLVPRAARRRARRRAGHRLRRGRGHPGRPSPPGLHQVLDPGGPRRLRPRPLHRQRPGARPRRRDHHRRRPRRRRRALLHLAGRAPRADTEMLTGRTTVNRFAVAAPADS